MTQQSLDYFELLKESKKKSARTFKKKVKVALLADCSTQHLAALLKVFLHRNETNLEIFEAEFDTVEMQIYNENSGLYGFDADYIVLLNTTQALRERYAEHHEQQGDFANSAAEKNRGYWQLLRERCPKAVIIQSNFALPYERLRGNLDAKQPGSFLAVVRRLNAMIAEAAESQSSVLLNDLSYLAAYHGTSGWFDERTWILYKLPCALELLPYAAKNMTDIILTCAGKTVKCVILDLDNTLWGGVIGDDGLEGIQVGHTQEGEAYSAFQRYLRQLQRGGVLLAVCSKNDPANARLAFQKHPDMILREEDFAVFMANWENKADNIKEIQRVLNISWEHMLFLDDSAFERELVRRHVPGVIVPDLPEDPSDFVKFLSEMNFFETTVVSELDAERTAMIQADAVRKTAEKKFTDITEYLKSLEMKITLAPFDAFHLPRIAQLIQRSNQFNLTTQRYPQAECEEWMKRPGAFAFYIKLRDQFGDMGLVSVIILLKQGGTLLIDTWLMSCRVLLRGIEQYAMNFIFEYAKKQGASQVAGDFIPTDKNQMVRDFYQGFGFVKQEETPEGRSRWVLAVDDYQPRAVMLTADENTFSF